MKEVLTWYMSCKPRQLRDAWMEKFGDRFTWSDSATKTSMHRQFRWIETVGLERFLSWVEESRVPITVLAARKRFAAELSASRQPKVT